MTHSFDELVSIFQKGTEHLSRAMLAVEFSFPPTDDDPRKIHNGYVQSLASCYISKVAQLSKEILASIKEEKYLIYALSGRSLIETNATLRYYVLHQYKPLMSDGRLSHDEMRKLIEIDDRHLRGGRFDWGAFFGGSYAKLKDDAEKQLSSRKTKQKHVVEGIIAEQVNVLTCIEKWGEETPDVLVGYNLFCDLVHPNIGSSFLVASTADRRLYFSPAKGEKVGRKIVEQTFPFLVSMNRSFGDHLTMLMSTFWQEDEL